MPGKRPPYSPFYGESATALIDLIGVDRVLYGSDYPHPEGRSQPTHYADMLTHLTFGGQTKVLGGNLSRLVAT